MTLLLSVVLGCGGGGGGGSPVSPGPGATTPGDFSILATPAALTLVPGASASSTLSLTALNGFTQSVSVSFSGLPASITASPATFTLSPGGQQVVTFSASGTSTLGAIAVTAQAVAGALSHSVALSVVVNSNVLNGQTAHAPGRVRYLRTNASYDPNALQFAPPHFSAYDAAHRQFFVSNPFLNEIDVFDANSESQIATIAVPFAWGIDVAPSGNVLYAATLLGDLYSIDTAKHTVIHRYASPSIGPGGFAPTEVFVLSDGRLALLGGLGGLLLDGSASVSIWDPKTNTLDSGTTRPIFGPGTVCPNIQNVGAFAVSGDRTRVLAATIDEGGGGEAICSYDPIAKQAVGASFPPATFVRQIIPSPDGTRFFLTSNLNGVAVYDARTLAPLGQITGPVGNVPNAAGGAVLSLDGKSLYLVDQLTGGVASFDTSSLLMRNRVPSFLVNDSQNFLVLGAIDESGLIIGPMGHGVGYIDATQTTSALSGGYLGYMSPTTAPLGGGTPFTITPSLAPAAAFPGVNQLYLGQTPASGLTVGVNSVLSAIIPRSTSSGPADVTLYLKDGSVQIDPEAFSYGPTILEVVPNAATAEGGSTGAIIGYGFGLDTSGAQVSVGGRSATVTLLHPYPPISPYPFPVQALLFTIPPGSPGSAVDVTVTTPNGSATVPNAFHYVAPVSDYPLKFADLQSGLYDPHRDLYYFTDQTQIRVLSRKSGWQTPISLPSINPTTRLWALTESPDGSLLAVSDLTGQAIYVFNPDKPSSVRRFAMPNDYFDTSLLGPAGLACTNRGMIYFATADLGGTGTPAFHKLNIANGVFIDLGNLQSGGIVDRYSRVLLSTDGSRVYSEVEGAPFWLDTATDVIHLNFSLASNSGGDPDLAISQDGSTAAVNFGVADRSLNALSEPVYIDWETWLPSANYGKKFYPDGSILVQPLADGVDLMARNTGRLLYRVQVPFPIASVYDSMVAGPTAGTYGFITPTGVSFVDLSSLPIAAGVSAPFTQSFASRDYRSRGIDDRVPVVPLRPDPRQRDLPIPRLKSGIHLDLQH